MKNQYFSPRTLPQPPATFPELSGTATELSGAAQKLSGGGPAPARAESGRPQNWSPARNFQNTSFKRGFSEEININNHRPKSFLSLMEDAHKVLAANRKVIFLLGYIYIYIYTHIYIYIYITNDPATQSEFDHMANSQARWRDRSSAALWILKYIQTCKKK